MANFGSDADARRRVVIAAGRRERADALALVEAGGAGCPICASASRAAGRAIEHFVYEQVNDPAIREQLRYSYGLCAEHAALLARERGAPLAVAIVYGDITRRAATILERPRARLAPTARCFVCEVSASRERDEMKLLRRQPDILETARDRICAGHPRPAAARALPRGEPVRGLLPLGSLAEVIVREPAIRREQADRYRRLAGELAQIERHHDYRTRDEPLDAPDAWRIALTICA